MNQPTATDFPILDAARPVANAEHARVILDALGYAEPYIEETDGWTALPVRLVHNYTTGFTIEVGPYDFDAADILVLRKAIAAYDLARGR